jgi:Ser/Thr protein kinase RdoA (MazF antagonist)
MDERALFAAVLAEEFGWEDCTLTKLSGAPGAESQTFRVERDGAAVAVLHAYRQAWIDWIGVRQEWPGRVEACARLLAYLEGYGYSVPRVVGTRRGEGVALREGWAVLLADYVGGETGDYSAAGLRALGDAVGALHALPMGYVGESWWSLATIVPRVAGRLAEVGAAVPLEWRAWYEECLRELVAWVGRAGLPGAIIHADAWAGNAVIGRAGRATLIDWELSGSGPAVLDFGSLILHGHYDLLGCLPDAGRIAALVGGYCAQRRPTDEELAVLTDAIRFGPVYRSALFFVAAAEGMWGERPWRQIGIERERYPAGPALAAATLDFLTGMG